MKTTTGLISILLSLQPLALFADTGNPPAVCRVEWQILSGRIQEMDPDSRRIDLLDKNGNLAHIVVDKDVQIYKDWRLVSMDDLKNNDRSNSAARGYAFLKEINACDLDACRTVKPLDSMPNQSPWTWLFLYRVDDCAFFDPSEWRREFFR